MSVHDRVVKVVAVWGHLPTPPNDSDLLQAIWAKSHESFPFQPDAAQQLIIDLQNEFKDPPVVIVRLLPSDLNPLGNIKTVGDLATAVGQMPGSN